MECNTTAACIGHRGHQRPGWALHSLDALGTKNVWMSCGSEGLHVHDVFHSRLKMAPTLAEDDKPREKRHIRQRLKEEFEHVRGCDQVPCWRRHGDLVS